MRKIIALFAFLLMGLISHAQKPIELSPYIQQSGLYYSSNNVTVAGYGFGAGLGINLGKNVLTQTDLNIYWINGNAYSARFVVGYKRSGKWSPAVFLNTSVLWGSRTEVLFEDGSRPAKTVFAVGLKIAPLRFENEKGFVSVLECGYGIGQYQGKNIELSVLTIGVKFK